jgi:hypothetical protein
MVARQVVAVLAMVLGPAVALAQQPPPPAPLYPGAAPPSFETQPLPPLAPATDIAPLPSQIPPAGPAPPAAASASDAPETSATMERVFCEQPVALHLADPDTVAERYRPFIGIWSDASWTPALCAALIVETVAPEGTATILYVFGPMGSNARAPGGVLHGTGIIRDGELRFQNSDGSQFAFRPLYADLDGRLTTPQGQTYEAIFKKTP